MCDDAMCRQAYLSNAALGVLTKKKLAGFLEYLERINGGDGNGYGGFVEGVAVVRKGVKLTVEQVVEDIRSIQWDRGVIFHTRKASMGSICNENCHPFHRGDTLLAHNGHWALEAKDYIKIMAVLGEKFTDVPGERLIDITDSEVISYLVHKNGASATELAQGVILTMTPDGVRIHNHFGEFEGVELKEGVWLYGSKIPSQFGDDLFSLDRDTVALLPLEGEPVTVTGGWSKTFRTYGRSYDSVYKGAATEGGVQSYLSGQAGRTLPPPATPTSRKHRNKGQRGAEAILNHWKKKFTALDKEWMEMCQKNLGAGREPKARRLTKSEKKNGVKAGKILVRRLRQKTPRDYWSIELLGFPRWQQAAVELLLLLCVRIVDIPSLTLTDFAAIVPKMLTNRSGG